MIMMGSAEDRNRTFPSPVPRPGRRALVLSLVLFALPLAFAERARETFQSRPETRRSEPVAAGIEHIEIRRGDFGRGIGTDRWVINVLVLDPSKIELSLGRALDRGVGTETPSSIAARRGALAATNGGYFRTEGVYRGEPAGILALAGKVLSEPARKRPGLAVSNAGKRTRLAVVDVDFGAEAVPAKGARRRVDGVNRPRLDDELILYTPEFNRSTLTGSSGAEAVVAGGRVRSVRDGRGDTAIPPGGWVVSGHGASRAWVLANLKEGARVELKSQVRFRPTPPFNPEFVIGGGPRLVKGGRPAAATDPGIYPEDFAAARHPRTAAGVRADGRILLVTVDGRQPELSVGMTIAELTALLIELGAVEAVNMDGGGSTAMVVRNRVINSPSDLTGERAIGDALLVFLR
ncbi:MAG: phosphodiester glycosidase family protein [Candidatus Aminicenantes bacterium]|nr:phosphodiester glycosidase family protein [Candidatus Aminicenantes bacterium]